jgi:cell wall-associated NlpC family hydrolase
VAVSLLAFPAAAAPASTTTVPGPAPNQSQIDAAQSQVSQIEATLVQEEQRVSVLDQRYNTAMQNLQNAYAGMKAVSANLTHTRSQIRADKRLLARDAVDAYVFGTPVTGMVSAFGAKAVQQSLVRQQYLDQIVGDLTQAEAALQSSEASLQKQRAQKETGGVLAQLAAAQAQSLAKENEQAATAARSTLAQAQGQVAQQVAQAAVEEAQQEAAAAARAASQQQAQQAEAAARIAAMVAGALGGSASGAAAIDAANRAAIAAGLLLATGPISGTSSGSPGGMAAVRAAESQLGVPYVFGGETPGVGFDCSGLVQWAWAQAGVSIPRTTEAEWQSIPHVSLNALQPGDLLFYFNLDDDSQVDHVVMYTGSGPYGADTVIDAPFTGLTVSYSPIFTGGLIGAGRP